ncbi:S-(hydroxymethyl)glutathione dehydrogenase-like protein 1 [Elsinoe australis]|uniref:S-(Hydroxymethyl)glutathione dehydrogenase-like protein 1 n=1 Tax=Elsinoe australis TaxID=40998 RepID=A0A4U7ARU6_9PEZI|nr:S-(hydroxymethyl)glutathione dehydrogenase-like protein 1 [Elsinoe australis]
MAESIKARAIVSHGPNVHDDWKLEEVSTLPDVKDDEILVEMVASGICHTDVFLGTAPPDSPLALYPRIVGHEGSGYARYIGRSVQGISVGDPVLLSYTYCASCRSCEAQHLSYCEQFIPLNFFGRPTFKDGKGKEIPGSFFGQSSFASWSVVKGSSAVNVKGIVQDKKELALFAPLGCGVQTGSGTVVNAAGAGEKDVVVVTGLGGVGLSAIMGAKIVGARIIVGIDRVKKRLDLAKELGATHVIDSSSLEEGKTLSDAVKEICDGAGPTVAVETTGVPALIKACIDFTRIKGQVLQVGSAPTDFQLELNAFGFMPTGKTYRGVIEGESFAPEYVPKMIQWYREGRFPIDKFSKFMDAAEFQKGLHEMHTGETIKPILLW